MTNRSEQERFWTEKYAKEYIKKNSQFDNTLGIEAWRKMLSNVKDQVRNYLECGSNIGRNIGQLSILIPSAKPSIIEISEPAFNYASVQYNLEYAFKGAILESSFEIDSFDLVFTIGVLIHINPDQLLANMEKMYRYSRRFVLFGEYFNRTPTSIVYQGETNKLFKRDFGKLFINSFDVKLVDYGFLWGHLYDAAGFDDITWWLFEKS